MSPTFGTRQQSPNATPLCGRALTALATLTALAALATLTACSGSDPAPKASDAPQATQASAPSVTPEPAIPVGLEWTDIPFATGADPEAKYLDFTGAGAFWLVRYDLETTLHTTHDGATWQTLDLTTSGLPADAHLFAGTGGCGLGPAIDNSGDAVTIVYYQYSATDSTTDLLDRLWLVTITAGDNASVTVTAGANVGLENMPPPEEGDAFRTVCATGFAEAGGQRVMVGEGQWWPRAEAGNSNAFTAFEGANGTWSVYSTKASAFLGGDVTVWPAGVETVGGNIIAVLYPTYAATGFKAWVSPDGRMWEQASIAFPVPDADIEIDRMVASDDRLLVMTNTKDGTSGEATIWSTNDGVTWTSAVLGGGGYYEAGTLATTPGGYLASARYKVGEDTDNYAWTSPDGITWTPLGEDEDLDWAVLSAKGLGDGLVAKVYGTIRVSGNPWG